MGEKSPQTDIQKLLSYCDDLVGVLADKKDYNALNFCLELSKSVKSFSDSDFNATQVAISDYEKKINDCKHKIEVTRSEVVSDEEVDRLQKELDEEVKKEQLLREDLRVIVDKINDLDNQQLSIEEHNQRLKKLKADLEKDEKILSFYASVTNILPGEENQSKISGYIVEHNKKPVEKFEFDLQQESSFDICNKTWKMIKP